MRIPLLLSCILIIGTAKAGVMEEARNRPNEQFKRFVCFESAKTFLPKKFDTSSDGGDGMEQYFEAKPKYKWSYGARIGYKINPIVWVDAGGVRQDLTYQSSSFDLTRSQKVQVTAFLAGMTVHAPTSLSITPYGRLAVGVAQKKPGDLIGSGDDGSNFVAKAQSSSSLAWQVGAGLRFALSEHLDVDVGYRYFHFGRISTQATSSRGGDEMPSAAQVISGSQLTLGLIISV